jgi:multiple sugar transport system substrate-binding protein
METRNLLSGLTVVIVLGGLLVGCKTSPVPSQGEIVDLKDLDPGGQLVTYWYWYSQRREEVLLAMIDAFNASNEWGIVVRGEHAGDADAIYGRVAAGIPAGRVPDLALARPYQIAVYTSQEAVVDLTPYIESEEWGFARQEMDDFWPFVLQARYGLPLNCSAEVLYYNDDWLHELGYDAPPSTWEEFREMCCAASDADARTYGYEFSSDAFTFADMLLSRGGRMVNESATAYTFGDDIGLETLDYLQGFFDEGCAIPETEWRGSEADFGAGMVLFSIGSASRLSHHRAAVAEGGGFVWSTALLPTLLDTPRVGVYSESVLIFRTTPERQLAAWLFVKWLSEPQQQARWVRASGAFPVRASAAELLQDYLEENPRYAEVFDSLVYGVFVEPDVAGYGACRDAVGKMLTAVADGEDPEAWLAQTVEECDATLEAAAPAGR